MPELANQRRTDNYMFRGKSKTAVKNKYSFFPSFESFPVPKQVAVSSRTTQQWLDYKTNILYGHEVHLLLCTKSDFENLSAC